jgi:hypothetical protein
MASYEITVKMDCHLQESNMKKRSIGVRKKQANAGQ